MKMRTLLLATLLASPSALTAQSTDVFEISLVRNGGHSAAVDVIRLEADQLDVSQCCTVTIRNGSDAVATFQWHQISLVTNRSARGDRLFELHMQSGEILEVRADRMVPSQHGLVHFYTAGRLSGLTNQNSAQMVIDAGARIDVRRQVLGPVAPVRN